MSNMVKFIDENGKEFFAKRFRVNYIKEVDHIQPIRNYLYKAIQELEASRQEIMLSKLNH